MFTTVTLAWVAFRPLLKIIISTFAGYWVAKTGNLSIKPKVALQVTKPEGALRVIHCLSKVILRIALPAQIFAKVVPSINASNIPTLGPIILILVVYQLYGFFLGFFIKQLFWVPHRFRYGIYCAAGWGNYGEIPIATMLTIMSAAPFNGQKDIDQGIAYISIVVVFFMITLFPLGGSRLIKEDSEGPDADDENVQQALRSKQHRWLYFWRSSNAEHHVSPSPEGLAEQGQLGAAVPELQSAKNTADPNGIATAVDATLGPTHKIAQEPAKERRPLPEDVTFQRPNESVTGLHEMYHSCAPTLVFPSPQFTVVDLTEDEEYKRHPSPGPSPRVSCFSQLTTRLRTLPKPPTIALALACPIAVITPLKALFVPLQNPVIPFAPDGAPPLAFILDTATFLGSASVPLALICVGAALAKLKFPNGIRGLPLGAILSLTIGRLVLQPIIAVAAVEGLVRAGLISEADKVLRFTMIVIGGMPTSINLVWLTAGDNGEGDVDHLLMFLLPQYILMTFSLTALIAYALHIIF